MANWRNYFPFGLGADVFMFDEEFVSSNASGTTVPGPGGSAGENVGAYHWDVLNDDDGPFRGLVSEVSHPGIVQIETTTAVNMRVSGARDTTGEQVPTFDLGQVAFMRCIFRIPLTSSLATCNYGIGLTFESGDANVSGTTPLVGGTGLFFHKPSSNANWLARRVTAGSGSGFSSGRSAVLGDWIDARLTKRDDLGAGSWALDVNNSPTVIVTGVATSGLVAPLIWMSSTAALQRRFDVDKFQVILEMGRTRFTP